MTGASAGGGGSGTSSGAGSGAGASGSGADSASIGADSGGGGGANGSIGGGGGSSPLTSEVSRAWGSSMTLRGVALTGEHALGDRDLLFLGGHVRGRRVLATSMGRPGAGGELQSTVIAVASVDGPVAARFAACDLVPFAVGSGAGLPGEGEASASDDCAGEGDLRDIYCRCSGLAVPSTHRCVRSSLVRAHEVSCRVRAGEVARPCWARLHPKGPQAAPGPIYLGGPVGPPPPSRLFVVVPYTNGWSSARLGTAGQTITGRWLGTER